MMVKVMVVCVGEGVGSRYLNSKKEFMYNYKYKIIIINIIINTKLYKFLAASFINK